MVETSVCSWFRDKAYGTEGRQTANKLSEVNINWVFQSDECVMLRAKLLKIETVTLAFLTTLSNSSSRVWEFLNLENAQKWIYRSGKKMEDAFSI